MRPGPDDVYVIRPAGTSGAGAADPGTATTGTATPDRPAVLWSAPGSLPAAVAEVAELWSRRARIGDLANVSGPWGVVLSNPATREHILAADPVGVQPIHWALTATGSIAVSSWIAALADRPDVDDAIDYEGVLISEAQGIHAEELLDITRFRAIRAVPWGRALRIGGDGSVRTEKYWFPDQLPGPDESLTLDDCAELLRERIDAAVRRLTPTDLVVGAHVSGGLDCTAVACHANHVLAESGGGLLAGYSWAPSEAHVPRFEGEERAILDDVVAQEGFPIRLVHPDESGDWYFLRDINRYPQSTHIRERWVLPMAAADGVQVMLSGWGGDELSSFNGRAVSPMLVRQGRFAALWQDVAARTAVSHPQAGLPRKARSFAGALFYTMPPWVAELRDRAEAREVAVHEAEIDARLRAISPRSVEVRRHRDHFFATCADPREYRLGLLTGGHIQHRTSGWYQTGRLFGIDYRYPLLDLGVVEAAIRLPWWAFRSQGWSRVAYRKAVDPWVPASVAWNVGKFEPALFWPPERRPVQRKAPPPRRESPIDDPRLIEALQAADRSYDRGGVGAIDPSTRVSARPEAAAGR